MGGKQTDTPPASREQHAAALAASMPDDKAGLLAVALAAVQEQHAAVLAGFALVDVVLPAHKAFIVKKWAEQAQKKIEAIQAEKQAKREQERAAAALEKKRRELERQAAEAANLNAREEVGA